MNVIKMELFRLFKSSGLYKSLIISAVISNVFNVVISMANERYSAELNLIHICMTASIPVICMTAVIFISYFVCDFYKTGYYKNVICKSAHKYNFQSSRAVIVLVYTTILFIFNIAATMPTSLLFYENISFEGSSHFIPTICCAYSLVAASVLGASFFVEILKTKLPIIIYIISMSTTIMLAVVKVINTLINHVFSVKIDISDFIPSLYLFSLDFEVNMTKNSIIHGLVLSFAFFVLYNVLGAVCITKLDARDTH